MEVKRIRELTMHKSSAERSTIVSSASGLAVIGSNAYIVADDRLSLATFNIHNSEPGNWIALFDGELPEEHKARKKKKPDLEAICVLPSDRFSPHGALLAVPSGSKSWRTNGAFLYLDAEGKIDGEPLPVDYTKLFEFLEPKVGRLNIEGVAVDEKSLLLANRGNSKNSVNAILELRLDVVLKQIHDTHVVDETSYVGRKTYELGELKGVPLSFTDLCVLPDRTKIFSAAAELTEDAYDDGDCFGSVIGAISSADEILKIDVVDAPIKIEGVHVRSWTATTCDLLLVTDADSETIPAAMYSAVLDFAQKNVQLNTVKL